MSLTIVLGLLLLLIIFIIIKKRAIINSLRVPLYDKEEFPLNIYFNHKTEESENFGILSDAVREAVKQFNLTTGFNFFTINENVYRYPNIIMVQLASGEHKGCVSTFDGNGGVLAHATYPPFRRVCVDEKDIDFKPLSVVIMHEFGHILGMEHTSRFYFGSSLMHPYLDKRVLGLTEYDLKRLAKMYPFLK